MSLIPTLTILVVLGLLATAEGSRVPHFGRRQFLGTAAQNGQTATASHIANCKQYFFTQKLDNFGFGPGLCAKNSTATTPCTTEDGFPATYQMRYFVCGKTQNLSIPPKEENTTIFYYTGNEANVKLYIEQTGLMWENEDRFKATLIFAEHRYFGESLPFPQEDMPSPSWKLRYLTADQAIADYATHIRWIRSLPGRSGSPIIGFGGSYGGMLCSWLKIKYPTSLDGCIAGSAPILNFEGLNPPYNPDSAAAVETFDATAAGGSDAGCADNIRSGFAEMNTLAETEAGRATLSTKLMTCQALNTSDQAYSIRGKLQNALGTMAMGSYPYPSGYMLFGGVGELPPYPLRVACSKNVMTSQTKMDNVSALLDAALVFYNATGGFKCFDLNADVNHEYEVVDYLWEYLFCTTLLLPYGTNGKTDMYWDSPWSTQEQSDWCYHKFGVRPASDYAAQAYGGRAVTRFASNIFFSNGQLDLWMPGGVLQADPANPSIKTFVIPEVGHHIDLMFSNEKDTAAVKQCRQMEVKEMERWVAERLAINNNGPQPTGTPPVNTPSPSVINGSTLPAPTDEGEKKGGGGIIVVISVAVLCVLMALAGFIFCCKAFRDGKKTHSSDSRKHQSASMLEETHKRNADETVSSA